MLTLYEAVRFSPLKHFSPIYFSQMEELVTHLEVLYPNELEVKALH